MIDRKVVQSPAGYAHLQTLSMVCSPDELVKYIEQSIWYFLKGISTKPKQKLIKVYVLGLDHKHMINFCKLTQTITHSHFVCWDLCRQTTSISWDPLRDSILPFLLSLNWKWNYIKHLTYHIRRCNGVLKCTERFLENEAQKCSGEHLVFIYSDITHSTKKVFFFQVQWNTFALKGSGVHIHMQGVKSSSLKLRPNTRGRASGLSFFVEALSCDSVCT